MAETITLTNEQLQQLLAQAGQYGQNSVFGPSYVDQWKNGSAQMSALKDQLSQGTITQDQFDSAKSAINSSKASAAIGGGIAALQGATQIMGNVMNMTQIADTTEQENQIKGVSELGNTDYNSFEQINADYEKLAASPMRFDYQTIRGKSNEELAGGVATSALSGAAAGLAVGGPWGALAGGVVGLGAGLAGVFTGNRAARDRKERLELEADVASRQAQRNLSLANENMMDYNFRSGVSRRADFGGKINRKRSIEDFAARALRKPRFREDAVTPIVARHGEDGTIVRIKR